MMNLVSVYGAYMLILGNWVLSGWFLVFLVFKKLACLTF